MKSHLFHFSITLLVTIITLIGYGFWYSTVSAESASVADLQKQISEQTQTAGRMVSARSALAEIANKEAAIQSYFVPQTGVVAFINDLEAQGKESGSVVKVLSVSTDSRGAQSFFIISLTLKGSFDSVLRTVGSIEYAPYDISIYDFSLVQDDKNNWHADLKITVGSLVSATSTTSTI